DRVVLVWSCGKTTLSNFETVESYKSIYFVDFCTRVEPDDPVLRSRMGRLLHRNRGVKVNTIAVPLINLWLINDELFTSFGQGTWPTRVVDEREFLCAGTVWQFLRWYDHRRSSKNEKNADPLHELSVRGAELAPWSTPRV